MAVGTVPVRVSGGASKVTLCRPKGTEARAEVIVTVELRGHRFHGRYRSTDVIEASLRAYMQACNAIGESGILEGPSEFHVAGEYLWE